MNGKFKKDKDDAWYLVISDRYHFYKKLLDILESIKYQITEKHGML